MTVARVLAEFLARTSSSDLPRQAIDHAAMLLASTFASAAMGAGLESSEIIRSLARDRAGRPEASIWFASGPKLPVSDAAQVNAVMSDAAASDDSDLRNIVHAGTTLVASGLAMAERTGASGEEVLAQTRQLIEQVLPRVAARWPRRRASPDDPVATPRSAKSHMTASASSTPAGNGNSGASR